MLTSFGACCRCGACTAPLHPAWCTLGLAPPASWCAFRIVSWKDCRTTALHHSWRTSTLDDTCACKWSALFLLLQGDVHKFLTWRPAQAVGPVAVTSLLLGSGLPDLSDFTQPSQVTNADGEPSNALGGVMLVAHLHPSVVGLAKQPGALCAPDICALSNFAGQVVAYSANEPGQEYEEQQTRYDHAASQIAIIAGIMYTGLLLQLPLC